MYVDEKGYDVLQFKITLSCESGLLENVYRNKKNIAIIKYP